MSVENKTLGLIAGGGQFPLMAADAAGKQGFRVVAVAHEGETDAILSERVHAIEWIKLGQLGRVIKTFKKNHVSQALMAGSINKKRMFGNVRPDAKGLAVLAKLAVMHDDDILSLLARELEKEGIEIVSSVTHLPELVAQPGCYTKRRPSKGETEDVDFGWSIAKELGRLDIGQCVVVRRKTALALEAIEGTDETIRRGGRLAEKQAVVVKVSKPQQDMRFDVPSVGVNTIQVMEEVRATVLAIEAGKTLVFNRDEMVEQANKAGIVIICR